MSSFICSVPSDVFVPAHFVVNLDLPPTLRWQHILRLYIDQLRQVENHIESICGEFFGQWVGPVLNNILSTIMGGATRLGLVYYGEELKGFSEIVGISLGRLVLMQFVYECVACCTSIVCKNEESNTSLHIRTMDWKLDFLKHLTIDVDFQKNYQTIFKATTWVGYVGILTGMRIPNGYSISVNSRRTGGKFIKNIKAALSGGWSVGCLVRQILESTSNYDLAVEKLAQSSIIAPCYFTICGTSQSKTVGTLITRKQNTEENRWTVLEHGPIIQTNIDHWSSPDDKNILFSMERRTLAKKLLDQMKIANEHELWKLISTYPIKNRVTIYGTFMCPEYGIYHTRYPKKGIGFNTKERAQFISMIHIKDYPSLRLPPVQTCQKCSRKFCIDDNPGGTCAHTGTWHKNFSDCSYLKCRSYLKEKTCIGKQHWSCCYSLDYQLNTCSQSRPHRLFDRNNTFCMIKYQMGS